MSLDSDDASADVRVALARFEAKLDVALAQHGAKLEQHGTTLLDHENRLRVQEARPTVSPKQLGAVVLGVLGTLGALAPFLDRLYS